MRRFCFILVLFMFSYLTLSATNYYTYAPTGTDVTNVNYWWTNTNGTGSHPPNFTTDGNVFYAQNGHNMTASMQWSVRGTNSKVVIQRGGKITTGAYNHNIELDINYDGTYEVTHTSYSYLGFGEIDNNSNFVLNNSAIGFQDDVTYGNLFITSGTADVYGSTGITINGTLRIDLNGIWEGGQTNPHTCTIGNVLVNGGSFRGGVGAGTITYNISGNVTVSSGTFYGSYSSGVCNYNIEGNLAVNGGTFYGTYRSSGDLPSNTYYIAGDFTSATTNFYAVSASGSGYPSFYLTGIGKNLGLGTLPNAYQARYFLQVGTGASYTLTSNICLDTGMQFYIRGTLTATTSQIRALAASPVIRVFGTLKTSNTAGLSGSTSTTIHSGNSPTLDLWSGSIIEYNNSSSSQAITPLTTYKNLVLTGAQKTLNNDASVATSITVNTSTLISSGKTLTLTGSMSGTGNLSGAGNLTVAGTEPQINMINLNLNTLTINRPSGCLMTRQIMINYVVLTSGNLYIDSQHLYINQNLTASGGSLLGTVSSSLTLGDTGSAPQFNLPAITLGNLTLVRGNGCFLSGDVVVDRILTLTTGNFDVNNRTLTLNGTLSITDGQLISSSASTLLIGTGAVAADITIPALTLGQLNMSRTGRNCYLGGDLVLDNLTLGNGVVSIGANTLYIYNTIEKTFGALEGGITSNLTIMNGMSTINIPSVSLNNFTMNRTGGCSLAGLMSADNVNLALGTLNLQTYGLSVNESLTFLDGNITGQSGSSLYISTSLPLTGLPLSSTGYLGINTTGEIALVESCIVHNGINLMDGILTTNDLLDCSPGAIINMMGGSISDTPNYLGNVNIAYFHNGTTGPEIPPPTSVLYDMTLHPNIDLYAGSNIEITHNLFMMTNSDLYLNGHNLNLAPGAEIIGLGNNNIFGNIVPGPCPEGFYCPEASFALGPGSEISDFSVAKYYAPTAWSIDHYWDLHGTLSEPVTITLYWKDSEWGDVLPIEGKVGIYWNDGGTWVLERNLPVFGGGGGNYCTLIITHFSEWTIGPPEETVPVELSSFTATLTAQNYVKLDWSTQSETDMLGYYILRNTVSDILTAKNLNILIPANNQSTEINYSYVDTDVEAPQTYYYWLQSVELNGSILTFNPVSVNVTQPPVDYIPPYEGQTALLRIFPNPFGSNLALKINHTGSGLLRVRIFDTKGRVVKVLADDSKTRGAYNYNWNAITDNMSPVPSGTYFIEVLSGKNHTIQKAVLLK